MPERLPFILAAMRVPCLQRPAGEPVILNKPVIIFGVNNRNLILCERYFAEGVAETQPAIDK